MENRIVRITLVLFSLCLLNSSVFAWTGDQWGTLSRESILRNATEMTEFSWTPKATIYNQTSPSYPSLTYNANTKYDGEAYCFFNDPAQNWSEFWGAVANTNGGSTAYGNECSAFVSIAWKLPGRYNTTAFDNDAVSDGDYVTKLGDTGSGEDVNLLPGDALVSKGSHIVIFESYWYDLDGVKKGINVYEQSTYPKKRALYHKNYWTWSLLANYRPIRRNKIDEGNYSFVTKWGTQGNLNGQFNYPVGISIDSLGYVYVTDYDNNRVQKFNDNGGFITTWGSYGAGNGQMDCPEGIDITASGNLYITDEGNNRVQKFTTNTRGYIDILSETA